MNNIKGFFFYMKIFSILEVKFSIYLNRRVFVMTIDAAPTYTRLQSEYRNFDTLRWEIIRYLSEGRFLLVALHRRGKFANFCHDLIQNHLS